VKYICYGILQLHCIKQPSPFLLTVLYKVLDIESVIPSRDIIRVLDMVLASPLIESSCTLGSQALKATSYLIIGLACPSGTCELKDT
jgi:hypothetical protein